MYKDNVTYIYDFQINYIVFNKKKLDNCSISHIQYQSGSCILQSWLCVGSSDGPDGAEN